jgi:glycosyltransferase involved in cell wall biosynthesis
VLFVGRLESVKRVELAIAALAHVPPPLKLIVAGDGSHRAAAERAVSEHGLHERVTFAGAVTGDALIDLYAGSLAVVYAPFDEDYGYVTLEAFLCAKPVITATDSGGTLEFVVDDQNGFVCAPEPAAIGAALARLAADRASAARLGQAGRARAQQITWDGVVERLLG